MGYQALLFCPDEKLARVVSQVLDELEFAIDPVNEPFAAVKKMMAQRYDAVVVDFSDEQNTALLFKSAHNSTFNQSSLAIALVEGQAGVAKAYRIGANLVLTKPINVEQAKGTLRVARGLLKKNSDSAGASTSAHAAPVAPVKSATVPSTVVPAAPVHASPTRVAESFSAPVRRAEIPEFENAIPAMSASAPVENPVAQASLIQATAKVLGNPALPTAASQFSTHDPAPAEAYPPTSPMTATPHAAAPTSGAGAATAPAKEVVLPVAPAAVHAAPPVEEKPAKLAEPSHSVSSAHEFTSASDAPSFGAVGEGESSEGGGNKKILIAAAVILVVAAVGYFGWTKFGGSQTSSTQPSANIQAQPKPVSTPAASVAPSQVPVTSGTVALNTGTTTKTSTSLGSSTAQPGTTAQSTKIDIVPEPAATKPAPAPIQVRTGSTRARTQTQAEDAPQVPSPLAVASGTGADLGGLISSSPSSVPKLTAAPTRISQGVIQGLLIKRVQPKYPAAALAAHIHGEVRIEATINKEGKVVNPKVLRGDQTLAAAALDAVRQWRYKPYQLDGTPVEIQTDITINFASN